MGGEPARSGAGGRERTEAQEDEGQHPKVNELVGVWLRLLLLMLSQEDGAVQRDVGKRRRLVELAVVVESEVEPLGWWRRAAPIEKVVA